MKNIYKNLGDLKVNIIVVQDFNSGPKSSVTSQEKVVLNSAKSLEKPKTVS